MLDYPILSVLTFLPLLGAAAIMMIGGTNQENIRNNSKAVALLVSGVNLLLAVVMLAHFKDGTAAMQFVEKHVWIQTLNINYHLGVDGISVYLVALTALLVPLCILVSWQSVTDRTQAFMANLLALEGLVIGVFCALDFVLFYVFWEAMLIPMFLLIGVWGGANRVYAAVKFFLYTFAGSVLMLVAMFYLYNAAGQSFDIQAMSQLSLSHQQQFWLFLALFVAFAVKVPMWPFHTWLPDAHVQAPTAGSVILAGVLLKMGAYGFLRFSLPMLPDASAYFAPVVMGLSVVAIVYAALVAFAQTDIKKMIAYSSVSHMGFVTLGIFAGTQTAVEGAVLQMLNHGVVSAALFMLVGVIYERMHTRELSRFGGVVQRMPVYAVIFGLFVMASVGLPGTNSFVGEFLILVGSYPVAQSFSVVATLGVLLGAVYMLWLYRNMVLGEALSPEVRRLTDLSLRERLMFVPLVLAVLWVGLAPNGVLEGIRASVAQVVQSVPARNVTPIQQGPYEPSVWMGAKQAHDTHSGHQAQSTTPNEEAAVPGDAHHTAPETSAEIGADEYADK